ncbi:GNAT family N-acetyltransferase [Gorillibacterium sp. sgz500922]|uniref:GNAT family N-acetyltransferase n=1 Tax=Gorillibacterium sp. sgz500922 TaxID=3446694 RepID=UPI003F67D14A
MEIHQGTAHEAAGKEAHTVSLTFTTFEQWEKSRWKELAPIYKDSFPHGAKPERILRRMVDRGLASLHGAYEGDRPTGMAITGFSRTESAGKPHCRLLIDYLAMEREARGQGIGRQFFGYLRDWAVQTAEVDSVLIEAEAEDTPENRERLRFWEGLGFEPNAYVHQYRWVPEPYRALLLPLHPGVPVPEDGEALFKEITRFHSLSFGRG